MYMIFLMNFWVMILRPESDVCDIFNEFLGHNFASGLRTLNPKTKT